MKIYPKITVEACFLEKGSGNPLNGDFVVKMFDKDIITDDYLGECPVNKNGEASLTFSLEKVKSLDSPLEKYPDLYFVLFKGANIIYKSKVLEDLNFDEEGSFDFENGKKYDIGTFLIDIEE